MDNEAIQSAADELQLSVTVTDTAALMRLLTARVNYLIEKDFHQLVSILYRLDINEDKIKWLLEHNPGEDAATMISNAIIERQAEKIKSKREFKQPPPQNEEEAW